jgi:transaldolase
LTKLHDLNALGQSVWIDYIRRSFIEDGGLQAMIDQGARGVTSNPTIFDKAIAGSDDYDSQMAELVAAGKSVNEIYDALAIEDIQNAADVLRPVFDDSDGGDGFVSLEVSPTLAHDTAGTVADARRYFAALNRPNIMIKVPATPAGVPAIETLIGEGININVTLIFSLSQYEAVVNAYIAGLEKLAAAGGDLSKVNSVASFFVSRVDGVVDKKLIEMGNKDLEGKIAIANAKVAYACFSEWFSGERWDKLAAQGARAQRPLWASTSTKNPEFPDTLYVDTLIGPHTVNTMPTGTIDATLDHGTIEVTIDKNVDEARAQLEQLAALGIDLGEVTQALQDAGVKSFAASFESLMNSISEKRTQLQADGSN